jgi:hypothetical protein
MEQENNNSEKKDDWEKRTLCGDPACIGVIGSDGCCKECGKPYEGGDFDDRPFEDLASESEAEVEDEEEFVEADEEEDASEEEEFVADEEWEKRTLCSDPACIGVIGSDGRCKECGKPYAGGLAE